MKPTPPVLAYLAARGAPHAKQSQAGAPAPWSSVDWRAHLAEVSAHLLPDLPQRLRSMVGGSATYVAGLLAAGALPAADLQRHAELEDGCTRMLLVRGGPSGAPIYLDNNASTPVDPRVVGPMVDAMLVDYGNPHSADHVFGDAAKSRVEGARVKVAALLDAAPADVHFTSGATESIRLGLEHALKSIAARTQRPAEVLVLPAEHRAVLGTLDAAVAAGRARVRHLVVDSLGRIRSDALVEQLRGPLDLLVCMGANNEIGNVYPIGLLTDIAHAKGAQIFVDGTQWVGKEPMSMRDGIDMLALSAHKLYGPKGVGAIVVRGPLAEGFEPPGGTPATPVVVGMGEAAQLARFERVADEARIGPMRDRLEAQLLGAGLGIVRNGDGDHCLAGTLHVSVPGLQSEILLGLLRDRVALSTGAACASARGASSHVLASMALPDWRRRGALRIGLGRLTTPCEVADAGRQIVDGIRQLRSTWVEV